MARCHRCGNSVSFNVWCTIRKVLVVDVDDDNNLVGIAGEPDDESLQSEEIAVADGDLGFSIVSCAWCGSRDIELREGERIPNVAEQ